MARILFTTWEGGGHVQPLMLVARGLQARGHDVLVISDACNAPDADAMGLPFRFWRHAPSRPDKTAASDLLRDWEADNPMEAVTRLCERIIAGPAGLYARDVLETLDTAPFDLVVSQELLFGPMMAAEKAGVPLALFCANVWPFPTLPGLPPFGAGMAPAEDDQGRMLHEMVGQTTRTIFQAGLPALNAARQGLGLSPLHDLFEQLAVARAILLGTSRAFDFAPEPLAAPFAYVGPYVADPVDVQAWRSPWPDTDSRSLVVVTSSSLYEAQEPWLARAMEALAGLPVRAVVTLGPALDPARFPGTENVHVAPSAPHGVLFAEAAAVVTHGGHGSVLRPLIAGAPVLILPGLRDQRDNAARVTHRGAGLMLERDASSQAIAEAVSRLLAEPAFREAATDVGQGIAADLAARSAEDALEALLATR